MIPFALRAMMCSIYCRRYSGGKSRICCEKTKRPNVVRVAVNENDSVRTSTLATFVVVMIEPIHGFPGGIVVSFMRTARICGGASGAATRGRGKGEDVARTMEGLMSSLEGGAAMHEASMRVQPHTRTTRKNRRMTRTFSMGGKNSYHARQG